MLLIPVEVDAKTIAEGFRKAPMFVFIDAKTGIVVQENHFKTDKSALFFTNFEKYAVDNICLKNVGYKTYLKLKNLGIEVFLIPEELELYTHIDLDMLVLLNDENAKIYCTMGHHKKDVN